MRVVVCGLGSIGKRHARNLLAQATALGLDEVRGFDARDDRRREAAAIAGLRLVESAEALFDGADLAYVAVPTSAHVAPARSALEAGCHLFIEKPIAHALDGVADLLAAAEGAGKVVAVGYVLRFHPIVRRLRDLVLSGAVGRPLSARAEVGQYLPDWHPHEDYRAFYMAHREGGGGALLDMSHEFDYLHWTLGAPRWVCGHYGTVSDLDITSDDLVEAVIGFGRPGAGRNTETIASVHLDLLDRTYHRACRVVGAEATIEARIHEKRLVVRRPGGAETVETFDLDPNAMYLEQNRVVVEAARGRRPPPCSGREAIASLEIVEAVRRSTERGVRVELPLLQTPDLRPGLHRLR